MSDRHYHDENPGAIRFENPRAKAFMLDVIAMMTVAELLNYLAMTHGFDLEDYARGTTTEVIK